MAGDIGNQHANAFVVDHQEIVEVAGDSAHREMAGGDVEPRQARDFTGKERGLNLACDFEFFVDFEEAFFVDEGTMRGYVAEAADANRKPRNSTSGPGRTRSATSGWREGRRAAR